MCVIFCCEKESGFPTLETLKSAQDLNPDGAGLAWINKDKEVQFIKGLNAKQIHNLIKKKIVSLPCIIHFRIGTIGDNVKELTHPFPITLNASTKLSGIGQDVLFHNGNWPDWNDRLLSSICKSDLEMPKGHWSDSRALAFLARRHGYNILNLISENNKIAIMTPEGITKFGSFIEMDKISCSNTYFKHAVSTYYYANDKESETTQAFNKLNNRLKMLKGELLAITTVLKHTKKPAKKNKLISRGTKLEQKIIETENKIEDLYQNTDIQMSNDEYRDEYDSRTQEPDSTWWQNYKQRNVRSYDAMGMGY